jgi:L-ribulose-5-phosphate 4-epimerase
VDELDAMRVEVSALHAELPRHGLVVWTSGNLSARVPAAHGELGSRGGPDADLMVIKPSGVPYDELTPEAMVACDLHGEAVEGTLAPSSDAATHGYIYRHLPDVGGIAHTHSPFATAWAVRGEPIPCVMTAMADEFGGEIPVGPFALIGGDEIGRAVVEAIGSHRSPAVLMRGHGVFTLGAGPREAIKAAVACEEAARITHLARLMGPLEPLEHESIDALYDRYQHVYGQH